jgi:hypothetical protein
MTYRGKGIGQLKRSSFFEQDKEYLVKLDRKLNYFLFAGIDLECVPLIIKEDNHYILIRIPGHKGWVGRNDYQYREPCYMVVEKIREVDDHYWANWLVKVIAEESYDRKEAYAKKNEYLQLIGELESKHG